MEKKRKCYERICTIIAVIIMLLAFIHRYTEIFSLSQIRFSGRIIIKR